MSHIFSNTNDNLLNTKIITVHSLLINLIIETSRAPNLQIIWLTFNSSIILFITKLYKRVFFSKSFTIRKYININTMSYKKGYKMHSINTNVIKIEHNLLS